MPIFRHDELVETRAISLTLETREGHPLAVVRAELPQLRQEFQFYLNAFASRGGLENLDNDAYIKSQLLKASEEFFHEHPVYDVLLQEEVNRPADMATSAG